MLQDGYHPSPSVVSILTIPTSLVPCDGPPPPLLATASSDQYPYPYPPSCPVLAGLVCKTKLAFDRLGELHPGKKWYLRLMDDTLVILPNLLHNLRRVDPSQPWCVITHTYTSIFCCDTARVTPPPTRGLAHGATASYSQAT